MAAALSAWENPASLVSRTFLPAVQCILACKSSETSHLATISITGKTLTTIWADVQGD